MRQLVIIVLIFSLFSCSEVEKDLTEPVKTSDLHETNVPGSNTEKALIAVGQEDTLVIDSLPISVTAIGSDNISSQKTPEVKVSNVKVPINNEKETEKDPEYFAPPTIIEPIEEKFNHQKWDLLLHKYVSSSGKVNYKGFQSEEGVLNAYLEELKVNKPGQNASKNEKLAYWINVYNAFTVKLILENYPVKSIMDINKAWDQPIVDVGKELLSLSYVENEILRKMNEPRIHFAINCASVSCPKLLNEAFVKDKMEQQLSKTTKSFLNDVSKNDLTKNPIELSKLFEWYSVDFENGKVIQFINKFTSIDLNESAKFTFKEYDWLLNE